MTIWVKEKRENKNFTFKNVNNNHTFHADTFDNFKKNGLIDSYQSIKIRIFVPDQNWTHTHTNTKTIQ